jgi:hypothetical protein
MDTERLLLGVTAYIARQILAASQGRRAAGPQQAAFEKTAAYQTPPFIRSKVTKAFGNLVVIRRNARKMPRF